MSSVLPYFRWFWKEYASDWRVLAMSDDQDLIYRRMIDKCWEIGPLPNEPVKLAAIVRMQCDRFADAWKFPLTDCWHENKQGLLINNRLEDEREFSLSKADKATKAANVRWGKRNKRLKNQSDKRPCKRNANALPPHRPSNAINDRRSKIEDKDLVSKDSGSSEDHSHKETPSNLWGDDKSSPANSEISTCLEVEKALWVDGKLVINEQWLRVQFDSFYLELDKVDPTAAKLRLNRPTYEDAKRRLHEVLLIHTERRAVPASTGPKKRGFATMVLRHFKRTIIDMRKKQFKSFADRVDDNVASLLMRAKQAKDAESKALEP